jgi:hypothetical protein
MDAEYRKFIEAHADLIRSLPELEGKLIQKAYCFLGNLILEFSDGGTCHIAGNNSGRGGYVSYCGDVPPDDQNEG